DLQLTSPLALQVAIEYLGLASSRAKVTELPGARQDAKYWKEVLMRLYGYQEENIVLMTDSVENDEYKPTFDNIYSGIPPYALCFIQSQDMQNNSKNQKGTLNGKIQSSTTWTKLKFFVFTPRQAIMTTSRHESGKYLTIKDNRIKALMVDPLVSGSVLIAVLDVGRIGSSHSRDRH
ncbi:hypothetical protein FRB99_000680, partial [Tulasnella sp. 403]